jgi:hypothetical protein
MDRLVAQEISKLNATPILSDFEIDVAVEIGEWLMSQKNWLETYGSYEKAAKVFWENRLDT